MDKGKMINDNSKLPAENDQLGENSPSSGGKCQCTNDMAKKKASK
jgi:hypothetical protein